MTVDNRGQEDAAATLTRQGSKEGGGKEDGLVSTPLEKLIHTKWMEAKITFHGTIPANIAG